jgi:ankyrin repeat protein
MAPRPPTVWQAARKGDEAILAAALASGDEEAHASLLKGSPSDEEQRSPAHLAAAFGHVGCLRLLLPLVGKVKDRAGRTPLHAAAAATSRPEESIALLLDEGANVHGLGGVDAPCSEHGGAVQTSRIQLTHSLKPPLGVSTLEPIK